MLGALYPDLLVGANAAAWPLQTGGSRRSRGRLRSRSLAAWTPGWCAYFGPFLSRRTRRTGVLAAGTGDRNGAQIVLSPGALPPRTLAPAGGPGSPCAGGCRVARII